MYGFPKISLSSTGNKYRLGQKLSEETKVKMSEAKLGKICSQEHRDNMSEYKKGDKHPQFGMTWKKNKR